MVRKRGGRPKTENPRNRRLGVYLTERELFSVQRKLQEAGLSAPEALRLLLLGHELPKKVFGGIDPSASAAWSNLAPLQSNLNQIARHLNASRIADLSAKDALKIAQFVEAVELQVRQLRREILEKKAGLRS